MKLLAGIALAGVLATQGASSVVAGWTIGDPPSPTDNGSTTVVQIRKTAPGVEVTYVAFAGSEGGTISVDFAARAKCRDQWFGARFTFDDPEVKDEVDVRGQIHEAFGKYIAKCGAPATPEGDVMRGFSEAFAAVEKRIAEVGDKPFDGNAM